MFLTMDGVWWIVRAVNQAGLSCAKAQIVQSKTIRKSTDLAQPICRINLSGLCKLRAAPRNCLGPEHVF